MRTIDFFDRGAAINPDHICMVDEAQERTLSYREVREMTLRIANGLRATGFSEGDHGAVYSPNSALGFTCTISLFRAGMPWVPVNPRNALEENIAILDDFDCQVLFYHSVFEPQIAQIREQAPGIRMFVCLDKVAPEAPALEAWITEFSTDELELRTDADSTALVDPTGGTTGRSKGVVHTNGSFAATMELMETCTPYETPPVYLAVAPLTHAGGYVAYSILARGGTLVIQAAVEPQSLLSAIEQHKVTTLFLPPTVIYALLAQPHVAELDFASLKHFLYGASPMAPSKLAEALDAFGPVMVQVFGQTESLFPITCLSADDHFQNGHLAPETRLRSCGRVVPQQGLELAVMSDDGQILADGERGELVLRGRSVMKAYYKQPDLTSQTIVDGWLHTGDVGCRDSEGFVYLVDRKKDMIISGGFNVFSAEVEKAVLSHPAVQECAVIGVPDDKSAIALWRMKQVANAANDKSRDAALEHEQVMFRKHLRSYDIAEGLRAFTEKRKPQFKGC